MCLAGGEELDGMVNHDFPVYCSFVPDPGCRVSRAFASLGFWVYSVLPRVATGQVAFTGLVFMIMGIDTQGGLHLTPSAHKAKEDTALSQKLVETALNPYANTRV